MRTVEQARALPMSASAVIHRAEVLEQLDQVRELLPPALSDARALLAEREQLLARARQEAEQLREQAQGERTRLVENSGIHKEARAEADRLLASARAQADALRTEVDDYVDGKLANMEVVLTKTLAAVAQGRARLAGNSELDDLRD